MLHLKGLTTSGLTAALLACGGLTKVKLHASIKSLFPQPLLKHLEARGCSFLWRDKEFQVYVSSFDFPSPRKIVEDLLFSLYIRYINSEVKSLKNCLAAFHITPEKIKLTVT